MIQDEKTTKKWVDPKIENCIFLKKTEEEDYTFGELIKEIADSGVKIFLKKDSLDLKWIDIDTLSREFDINDFCFKIQMKGGQGEIFVEDLMKVKLYQSQKDRESSLILIEDILKKPFIIKRRTQKFLSLLQDKVLRKINTRGMKILEFPTQTIISDLYKKPKYKDLMLKISELEATKDNALKKQYYEKAAEIREKIQELVKNSGIDFLFLEIWKNI